MSVLILSCPCGLRMKAKGATPGRVGRCPKCGQTLTVPPVAEPRSKAKAKAKPEVEAETEAGAEPMARGYGLNPTFHPAVADPVEKGRDRKGSKARRGVEAALVPEVVRDIEPWWRPDVLFPLRGAEALLIVTLIGLATWFAATLIPELCFQFIADGGFLMGLLVSIVVALPAVALGFFVVTYTLQYLGRVLVSGALGEVNPPRPPDRNFDGLSEGLAPWAIWLICGAPVGFAPLAAYHLGRGGDGWASQAVVVCLAVLGLAYSLVALMMVFIRDGGLPGPTSVVSALVRFHLSFLAVCVIEASFALMVAGAFLGALKIRGANFWVYLPLMLPCWMLALWMAMVAMRVLGVFYHHHAAVLRWHRKKPWWDVTGGS